MNYDKDLLDDVTAFIESIEDLIEELDAEEGGRWLMIPYGSKYVLTIAKEV